MKDAAGRLDPPSGHPPPAEARLGDAVVSLVPLAEEICGRYRDEFPDEAERYGDAGIAWCVHDNQHLLFWGAAAVEGWVNMEREVGWLANVLQARDFPLDRLARNLDLAAEVVLARVVGEPSQQIASVLTASASSVRLRVRGQSVEEPH